MDDKPSFSVVVPCFNEEEALPHTYTALSQSLEPVTRGSWEIIFVDDGSTDSTGSIIRSLNGRDPRVKGIMLTRNFGHQAAVWAGLEKAQGDYVGVIDGDLQDPVDVLICLFNEVRNGGVEICYGVRTRRDAPLLLRFCYRTFYRLMAGMSEHKWPLDAGDFCVMSRRAVEAMNLLPEKVRMLRGLRAWIGMKSSGLPYERPARVHGKTKYNLRRLVRLASDAFIGFSVTPLRIASFTGLIMAGVTLLFGGFIIANRLFPWFQPLGYNIRQNSGLATILLVLCFVSSLILFCLGVIGEYMSVLLKEVKNRPQYVVREILG